MKSKKDAIQESAIELFNEKGYEQVSLRDIAKHANTTIGNLNYHFPRKEDLLLHIQTNSHNTFDSFFNSNSRGFELLETVVDSFVMAGTNQADRPFYYKNVYDLTKGSSEASSKNMIFQQKLYEFYYKSFKFLVEDGFLSKDLGDIELSSLVQIIITCYAVWLQSNTPYSNDYLKQESLPLTVALCSLLKSYIAYDKKSIFDNICKDKWISAKQNRPFL